MVPAVRAHSPLGLCSEGCRRETRALVNALAAGAAGPARIMNVETELQQLVGEIKRLGVTGPNGSTTVSFGKLVNDERVSQICEPLPLSPLVPPLGLHAPLNFRAPDLVIHRSSSTALEAASTSLDRAFTSWCARSRGPGWDTSRWQEARLRHV